MIFHCYIEIIKVTTIIIIIIIIIIIVKYDLLFI